MPLILVTGANGFIGRTLVRYLSDRGHRVRALCRSLSTEIDGAEETVIADLASENVKLEEGMHGADFVVHLAARVHEMRMDDTRRWSSYNRLNVAGSERLAIAAAKAGARRLVFLSSIKVNGERTGVGGAPPFFTADDQPNPCGAYAVSKLEAERRLMRIAENLGLEVTIIRPPLVYGPGVKANFFNLMRWLHMGIPLPFKGTHNRRSLIGVFNLIDLIVTCLEHPRAANQLFLASDDEDMSTTELLVRVGSALHKPARLFGAPAWAVKAVANGAGRGPVVQRLLESLQVDITRTKSVLNWSPPYSVDSMLDATATHYIRELRG